MDPDSTGPRAAPETAAELVDEGIIARCADRAAELVAGGELALLGEGGLLQELTRQILVRAVESEFQAHLDKGSDNNRDKGRDNSRDDGRDSAGDPAVAGNSRSGYRERTVLSEVGPMRIRIPRDRSGTFRSQILPPRLRRLPGLDRLVVSLVARGLTTREVVSHLAEVYGVLISRDTVSRITDTVLGELETRHRRPLEHTYTAVYLDSYDIHVHGEGQRLLVHAALGVSTAGRSETLGIWAGPEHQGARSVWTTISDELRARQVRDIRVIVCDAPDAISGAVAEGWPTAIVQPSIPHLLRSSLQQVPAGMRADLAAALRAVAGAATGTEALLRLAAAERRWGDRHPHLFPCWRRSLAQLAPLFRLDPESRGLLTAPSALEGLRARFHRICDHSGYLPGRQAVLKRFQLATLALDPEDSGADADRWTALHQALLPGRPDTR